MKRVTFEVAKAIKKADYPQGITNKVYAGCHHQTCHRTIFEGYILEKGIDNITKYDCDIPTYIDVWFWLWREKKIKIKHVDNFATYITGFEDEIELEGYEDPEEAIIAAIDYLVDNDLII